MKHRVDSSDWETGQGGQVTKWLPPKPDVILARIHLLAWMLPLVGLAAADRVLFDFESGTLVGWTAEGGEWTNCVVAAETVSQWREDRRPQGMIGVTRSESKMA